MRRVTATELRTNMYKLLDEVLATGAPLVIERRGQILRIVPEAPASKLDQLVRRRNFVSGDPDDLVHLDWSAEWRP